MGSPDAGLYVSISGLVALHLCPVYSYKVHGMGLNTFFDKHTRLAACAPGLIACLYCTPLALHYQSTLLAYMATMAICHCLGFSVLIFPFCYCIGWRDKDTMICSASTGAVLLTTYTAAKIMRVLPVEAQLFESPISVMGCIMMFLCLLIVCNLHYDYRRGAPISQRYCQANVVFLLTAMVCVYVGNVFVMTGLANTATVFLVMWCLEKYAELHFELKFNVWIFILFISAFMYKAALWLHTNPAFVASLFSSFSPDADAQVTPLLF